MNEIICDAWLSAVDEIGALWRASAAPRPLESEKERAIEGRFDEARAAGNLPGALLAVEEWKRAWRHALGASEGMKEVIDGEL